MDISAVPKQARTAAPTKAGRGARTPWPRLLHRAFVVLMYLFMLSPLIFVLWLSFFKDAILYFPPSGYTFSWYAKAITDSAFVNGFLTSFQVAAIASVCGVILGVAAALGIIRYRFRGS